MNIAIVDDRKTDSDRLVGFIDTYAEQHRLQWGAMDRFSSGEEFLGAFTAGKYDLIFLDENMPGISGLETLAQIKDISPTVPVIMITKSEEEDIMDMAIGSKIADYLIKPVNPNQILLSLK